MKRCWSSGDTDGLALELVASDLPDPRIPWNEGPVPRDMAIRGLYSVSTHGREFDDTVLLLTGTLGFVKVNEAGDRSRYGAGDATPGNYIDLVVSPNTGRGQSGAGTVHHVAWRTSTGEEQRNWREICMNRGLNVSPVMDRSYFESIYFREPGGVLFEIATDAPGFAIDESTRELGSGLQLPEWLEGSRQSIEKGLPVLRMPSETIPTP